MSKVSIPVALILLAACTPESEDNPFGISFGSLGTLTAGDEMGDSDSGTTDPSTTDPSTTDPSTTDPSTTDPSTTGDPTTGGDCPSNGPYQGGWDTGCCQDEVIPTGWFPGSIGPNSVLPDWTFTDQFGDAVRLYDFCHKAMYFEYVAFW